MHAIGRRHRRHTAGYGAAPGAGLVPFLWALPLLAQAQSSPFMTGATALQTNILAWLTPIAVILVMVLGAMAMANRVAQVSSTYGGGEAQTIVENCGNTLILRCSASEHGGTSQFASRLIGQREVLRVTTSRSQRSTEWLPTITRAEHLSVEPAVMASEIEQLPDLCGYLKLASRPEWRRVRIEAAANHLEGVQSRRRESAVEADVSSVAEHLSPAAAKILSFRRAASHVPRAATACGERTEHEETSALREEMSAVREPVGTPAHDGFEPE